MKRPGKTILSHDHSHSHFPWGHWTIFWKNLMMITTSFSHIISTLSTMISPHSRDGTTVLAPRFFRRRWFDPKRRPGSWPRGGQPVNSSCSHDSDPVQVQSPKSMPSGGTPKLLFFGKCLQVWDPLWISKDPTSQGTIHRGCLKQKHAKPRRIVECYN